MKLRLQEKPVEWIKFTAVMGLSFTLLAGLLLARGWIGRPTFLGVIGTLAGVVLISLARPRWFRGFYRAGMTVSWHVGQVMGRVLLTVFFLVIVTPMGLMLRLFGKDLLGRRRPNATTYWHTAKPPGPFERQF
jgi:hypothetical protein